MNNVNIIGRVVRDIQLNGSDTKNCRFTVAVNRNYKNKDGGYDADFIPCVAWRQTAEFISKYFTKGSRIALSGSIQTGSYEKDGVKVYTTEVLVTNAEFVDTREERETKATRQAPNYDAPKAEPVIEEASEDDLPF